MFKRKPKRGGVALGFFLTFGILLVITIVLIQPNNGVSFTTAKFPDKLPTYGGILQKYAPSDALQVSFNNLTAVRAINRSVISNQQFLKLDTPQLSLNSSAIGVRLTVVLSNPNATITVVTLDPGTFSRVQTSFNQVNGAIPTGKAGNLTLYAVIDRASGTLQADWLTMIPSERTLLFSPGANDALQAISHVVGVYSGKVPSILTRNDTARMLYAVNGTEGHLALGIQNFVGTVRTGEGTLISIDSLQGSAQVSYVVKFANAGTATAEVSTVEAAYKTAHQFFQYDELVKAVEVLPDSQLDIAVGLAG